MADTTRPRKRPGSPRQTPDTGPNQTEQPPQDRKHPGPPLILSFNRVPPTPRPRRGDTSD